MYQVSVKTSKGEQSLADYKQIPEKFSNKDFSEEEIKELFTYIKENWNNKTPIKDAVIVKENNFKTKFIGKWNTYAVGGYGYGGIVNVFNVMTI